MLADIKRIAIDNKKSELESEIKRLELELEEVDTKINEVEQLISDCSVKAERERNKLFNRIVNRIIVYKSKTSKEIGIEEENYNQEKNKLNNEREEILKKISDFKVQISIIEKDNRNIEVLKRCGLNFKEACDLLNSRNIPVVLDESDLVYDVNDIYEPSLKADNEITQNNDSVDMSVMKDYVLVHKTDYYPKMGRIKTAHEAKAYSHEVKFKLDKLGTALEVSGRQTIHFAVNGEVGDVQMSSWKDKRYAVLIPFSDMPISQFRGGAAMDTYIEGGLNLPSSAIILCPVEELEMVKRENPNQSVIGYKGKTVTKFANAMVSYLGYKVELVEAESWRNLKSQSNYYAKLKQAGLDVHTDVHWGSREHIRDGNLPYLENFIFMIKKIILENIVLDSNDFKTILEDVNVVFAIDSMIMYDVLDLLKKQLSPYGIDFNKVGLFNPSAYPRDIYFAGMVRAIMENILAQAMQIVQNNLEQERSKGR